MQIPHIKSLYYPIWTWQYNGQQGMALEEEIFREDCSFNRQYKHLFKRKRRRGNSVLISLSLLEVCG